MERGGLAQLLGAVVTDRSDAVIVCETDVGQFQSTFAAAVGGRGPVFLADPKWREHEREQFKSLVAKEAESWNPERGWLMIPTGGSSGQIKLARHDQDTIAAAVAGFVQHTGLAAINAHGVLPLHHVGGLMGWLRCVLTGGRYTNHDWRKIAEGAYPSVGDEPTQISLVPTQLTRVLEQDEGGAWLRQYERVLVGGGPAWSDLLAKAREQGIRLMPSYGMTETAAMIAGLSPEAFLAGAGGVGPALPHAEIRIDTHGEILIRSESLFRGFWPTLREPETYWKTNDQGQLTNDQPQLTNDHHLHIEGRSDALIITGGEKVNPAEVERVIREVTKGGDVAVVGVPDDVWGTKVVACFSVLTPKIRERIEVGLKERLAAFKRPKRLVEITPWPTNTMGKVNRAELVQKILASERSS